MTTPAPPAGPHRFELAAASTGRRAVARSGRAPLAALLLFLPAAGLLAFAMWQRQPAGPHGPSRAESGPDSGEPGQPERTALSGPVSGWSGRLERPGAPPLILRLETLHPHPARQAFDAAALAARFFGGPEDALQDAAERARDPRRADEMVRGPQPWRLTLSVPEPASQRRPARAAAGAEAGAIDAPRGSSIVVDDLSRVVVDGLVPLASAESLGGRSAGAQGERPTAERRALQSLFLFPDGPLSEGQACHLVFWGPPPSGALTVRLPGVPERVELLPLARASAPASEAIARFDARGTTPGTSLATSLGGSR